MTAGTYIIECSANHAKYVGSSIDCERRLKIHLRSLRMGRHHNTHLQNAFASYGESAFSWSVSACHKEQRVEIEYALIEELLRAGFLLFNEIRSPNGEVLQFGELSRKRMSRSGRQNWALNRDKMLAALHGPEASEKRKAALAGRVSTLPREHFVNAAHRVWELHREMLRAQASVISKRNWANPEYAKKMSDHRLAMWETQEHREKVAATFERNGSRAKHAVVVSDLWKDPEYREKNLAARKASGSYAKMIETRKKNLLLRQSAAKTADAEVTPL
jgi:group I intron endonuclease